MVTQDEPIIHKGSFGLRLELCAELRAYKDGVEYFINLKDKAESYAVQHDVLSS